MPILENVISSNEAHLRRVYDRLIAGTARRVALLGLSFKPGTDDLRESPLVELAERLLGKGFDLSIYDANVRISHLTGANRAYMDARIPHLSRLMVATPMAAVFGAEVVVLGEHRARVGRGRRGRAGRAARRPRAPPRADRARRRLSRRGLVSGGAWRAS